jgi:hypothetical protein
VLFSATLANLLCMLVEKDGFETFSAANGQEGLSLARKHSALSTGGTWKRGWLAMATGDERPRETAGMSAGLKASNGYRASSLPYR